MASQAKYDLPFRKAARAMRTQTQAYAEISATTNRRTSDPSPDDFKGPKAVAGGGADV
jgi:hypothetical protein